MYILNPHPLWIKLQLKIFVLQDFFYNISWNEYRRFQYVSDLDSDLNLNLEQAEMFYLLRIIILDISCNVLFKIWNPSIISWNMSILTFFTLKFYHFRPFLIGFYTKTGANSNYHLQVFFIPFSVWIVQISHMIP